MAVLRWRSLKHYALCNNCSKLTFNFCAKWKNAASKGPVQIPLSSRPLNRLRIEAGLDKWALTASVQSSIFAIWRLHSRIDCSDFDESSSSTQFLTVTVRHFYFYNNLLNFQIRGHKKILKFESNTHKLTVKFLQSLSINQILRKNNEAFVVIDFESRHSLLKTLIFQFF